MMPIPGDYITFEGYANFWSLNYFYTCTGYANSGSLYHAAKQLDQAMLVSKEENDFSDVSRQIEDMVPTEENKSPKSVMLSN